jgi:glycosyltransferase involved in cell wall biosynthesis
MKKRLSLVVPVYYNELNLPETIPRLLSLQDKLTNYELELIFVDDGSKDKSLEILIAFRSKNPDIIKVIKLTRNFGSMAAVQSGLAQTTGDCVGIISADLQDPPELFVEMIKHWENGIKAAFAVRTERQDPLIAKTFSSIYYRIFRRFALREYPKGGFDFMLIDRQVVDEFNKLQEKNTNIMTLIFWLGFDYVTVPYVRKAREMGKSRWTMSKKVKLAIDSFVAFSYFPIRLLSALGLIVAIGAFVYGAIVFYNWWIGEIPVQGWTALMIVLLLTSGLQMLMLGVLGEYLWRTLDESRWRPPFVIDKVYGIPNIENKEEKLIESDFEK